MPVLSCAVLTEENPFAIETTMIIEDKQAMQNITISSFQWFTSVIHVSY